MQQREHVKIGVEFWEVDAEPGGRDLDFGEVGGAGVFQALREGGREGDLGAGGQADHHPVAACVVVGGDGAEYRGRP